MAVNLRASHGQALKGQLTSTLKVKVTHLCPTLCDSTDCLQARILEWVVYPFSRGSSQFRNQTRVSCIAGELFTN